MNPFLRLLPRRFSLPCALGLSLVIGVCLANSARAAIVTVATGPTNAVRAMPSGGQSFNHTFNAGGTANAVLVSLSSESDALAGQVALSYAGFAFTPVIDQIGSQPSVWLLNLSGTTYVSGNATLTLNLTNVTTANGYGLGIVSVRTDDALNPNLGVYATNTSTTNSVALTTTLESFVIAGYRSNDTTDGAVANPPLTPLFGAQIGSSRGAAGYQESVAAGNPSYSFTDSFNARNSSAAAFVAVPEPSTALLGGIGMLALLLRRRR